MHLQSFLSTCALALTANAVLVAPEVEAKDAEFWETASPVMVAEAQKNVVLPCSDCPLGVKSDDGKSAAWKTEDIKTNLEMTFSVDDNKHINLNGVPFYPPTRENVALPKIVKQVYSEGEDGSAGDLADGLIVSTAVNVHEQMEIATVNMGKLEDGKNPLTETPMRRISFEIIGLGDKVVHLDTIELFISETDENLTLFGTNITPYTKHSTPEGDACTTVLCRVRATIKAHFDSLRAATAAKLSSAKASCMRKIKAACGAFRLPTPRPHSGINRPKVHGGVNKFSGDATLAPGGKNHPHGPYGNHGGHHHGHHHGAKHAMHVVGRFFRHVLLPILIGVAAGMAVSAVGMLIGQAVVVLFMRRRATEYQSVEQSDEESRASFDELPKYEEAPVYEEAPAYSDEKQEAEN